MKYGEAVKQAMEELARDERIIFLGYNVCRGSMAYGTLKDIPLTKRIETPVAENLMTGLAIGMALDGLRPVLYFERHDFILNAMDSLVNHLDKVEFLSERQFKAPVIIRAVVGGTKPFYPGAQHVQDFSDMFKRTFKFPVRELREPNEIIRNYKEALRKEEPTMFIERRDWYGRI